MSSRLSPRARRTVPFCRADQSLLQPCFGYPWWNGSLRSVRKLFPQRIAARRAARTYSRSLLYFPLPFILNATLGSDVSGLALPGVCATGNICSGSHNFQTACIPWCEGIGNGGMRPARPGRMRMGIWGNAWSPPAAADLAHPRSSLCGFSLTALYQHLILVQVPLFPPPCTRHSSFPSARGQGGQTGQMRGVSGVWMVFALFPGESRLLHHAPYANLPWLNFCSDKTWLVLFRREWPPTFCILLQ